MNKHELIQKYTEKSNNIRPGCLSVDAGVESLKRAIYDEFINGLKQLDEPKKEVVPQDVADFIEDGNRYDKIAFLVHQKYLGVNSLMRECPVKDWLRSVDYKTVLSLVNGYEVEKEQLYYVDFINDGDVHKRLVLDNENGKHDIVDWSENLIGLVQEMFTESDVKKANPDFMVFAVKVED